MQLIVDVQDHEGKSHKKGIFNVDDKATIHKLRDEIYSRWEMKSEYHGLYYKTNLLLFGTLQEAGIGDTNEIVLKHTMLQNWVNCLTIIEHLKRKSEHLKSKLAKNGSQYLQLLENTEFFITYPSFFNTFIEFTEQFDRYVIGIEENIKLAVKSYFKNYFHNEELNVDFIAKPYTGAQGGFICQVMGEEFFVKNHTFMGRDSNRCSHDKEAYLHFFKKS